MKLRTLLVLLSLCFLPHAFAQDDFEPEPAFDDSSSFEEPMDQPTAPTSDAPSNISDNKVVSEAPKAPSPPLPPASDAASMHTTEAPAIDEDADPIAAQMQKEKQRAEKDNKAEKRELVQHEGGKYHIGLDFAYHAFDDYDFDPTTGVKGLTTNGAVLQFLYFPLTYGWGRLGIGPVGGIYFTKQQDNYSGLKPSFWSVGGEVQYAALYGLGQTFVPYGLFGWEQVSLRSYIRPSGVGTETIRVPADKFSRTYYGVGLGINLNRVESRAASHALADSGIRKYYLVVTYKVASSHGTKGTGLLGLRFEF